MDKIEISLTNKCGVYAIINISTGEQYIGSSKHLYNRLYKHQYHLNHNNHNNQHLQNAWNKYTSKNFIYNILCYCGLDKQYEMEQYYINLLKPKYNIQLEVIGVSGSTRPPETKQKISNTLKKGYKTGKIKSYINDFYGQSVYIYNIRTWKLVQECKNIPEAGILLYNNKAGLSTNNIYTRLIKGTYIVSFIKFNIISDLKNYVCKNILYYKGNTINLNKYLIIENNSEINYFRTIQGVVDFIKCSSIRTLKKHSEASIISPYHIKNTKFKMYFTDIYISYKEKAVPVEESLGELLGNIGGDPIKENTEINSEISKGSESSYSIEDE